MKKQRLLLRRTIRAEISGAEPERFLNACMGAGLELKNVMYTARHRLTVGVREEDCERLKKIAELCQCEVRLLTPENRNKGKRERPGGEALLIPTAVLALLLALSSLFIWDIEVIGNETVSKREILRALSECGVREGCFWPTTDVEHVRSGMLLQEEKLAWMTLNVSGSRATAVVLERKEKPQIYAESRAADLMACRDGMINEMSVKNGRPAVRSGQLVAEGETLVSGQMESETGQTRYVRAEGEIIAETLHEKRIFLCPGSCEKRPLHGVHLILGFQYGKNRINLGIKGRKELDGCDKIKKEYTVGIKGIFVFPFSVIVEEYRPFENTGAYHADPAAAESRARQSLAGAIDGTVTEIAFTYEDGLLTMHARCSENIAVHREIE